MALGPSKKAAVTSNKTVCTVLDARKQLWLAVSQTQAGCTQREELGAVPQTQVLPPGSCPAHHPAPQVLRPVPGLTLSCAAGLAFSQLVVVLVVMCFWVRASVCVPGATQPEPEALDPHPEQGGGERCEVHGVSLRVSAGETVPAVCEAQPEPLALDPQ